MRDLIARRLRPFVDRLENDLIAVVESRISAEVERARAAFDIALSAYASDDTEQECPPVVPALASPSGQSKDKAHRDVKPSNVPRVRAYKPENYPSSRRDREDRTALQANGKKPVTCQKCGYVGGNKRGCGKSHPTQTATAAPSTPLTKPVVVARAFGCDGKHSAGICHDPNCYYRLPKQGAISNRLATIAARAPKPANPPVIEDEQDGEPERWNKRRIAEETEVAENRKHDGALPRASSSFRIDRGEVEELNFDAP